MADYSRDAVGRVEISYGEDTDSCKHDLDGFLLECNLSVLTYLCPLKIELSSPKMNLSFGDCQEICEARELKWLGSGGGNIRVLFTFENNEDKCIYKTLGSYPGVGIERPVEDEFKDLMSMMQTSVDTWKVVTGLKAVGCKSVYILTYGGKMALFDDEDHTTWSRSIQGLAPHVLSIGYRKFDIGMTIKVPNMYDGLDEQMISMILPSRVNLRSSHYNYYPHSRYHKHTTEESGGFCYSSSELSVETTTRGPKLHKVLAYTGSSALIVKNTKPLRALKPLNYTSMTPKAVRALFTACIKWITRINEAHKSTDVGEVRYNHNHAVCICVLYNQF